MQTKIVKKLVFIAFLLGYILQVNAQLKGRYCYNSHAYTSCFEFYSKNKFTYYSSNSLNYSTSEGSGTYTIAGDMLVLDYTQHPDTHVSRVDVILRKFRAIYNDSISMTIISWLKFDNDTIGSLGLVVSIKDTAGKYFMGKLGNNSNTIILDIPKSDIPIQVEVTSIDNRDPHTFSVIPNKNYVVDIYQHYQGEYYIIYNGDNTKYSFQKKGRNTIMLKLKEVNGEEYEDEELLTYKRVKKRK